MSTTTSQARIIVVEDEITVALSIRQSLQLMGYTVPELAASGAEAIDKIRRHAPDLVLMDIGLPGKMDGIEAARQINRRFGTPVIFITGHTDPTTFQRAKKTIPAGYIPKPFTEQELFTAVELALTRPSPGQNHVAAKITANGTTTEKPDRFRTMIEDIPALVCRFLADGTLTYVNAAYCAYFNKSRIDLIGSNFLRYAPKVDQQRVRRQVEALTPDAPVGNFVHQVVTPTHEVRWLQWTCQAIFDDSLNDREYQAVGSDITERKQAEANLLLSDQILQQMPSAIIVTDLSGKIQRWTGKARDIFGYSASEAVGRPISFIHLPQSDIDSTERILAKIKETGEFFGEVTGITKSGKTVPIEASAKPIFDKFGRPLVLICTLRDITFRKKNEQALEESEERFRLAFENANIGVWLIDLEGRLLRANNRMCQILGYNRDELERLNVNDVTHPQDVDLPLEFVEGSLAGKTDHITFEKRYIHKQGYVVWANASTSLVRDSFGQPLYFISHVQDITRQKLIETERERLISQLETKNTELERMTYTISHDLKSPLITIQGFLTLLEKDAANNASERFEQNIKFIRAAAKKMKQLVDDLLEISRIGRLPSLRETIPLSEMIREAISMVAGSINVRAAKVYVSHDMPTVVGDRARLSQVFQNLIDNAVKFMGTEPNPTIKIGGRIEGNFAVCYVKDNGIGIDPRYHHRIFNLFDRLDTDTEGSGVGLALAKRVVELHGGQIWVESAGAGQGSIFWVKLPLTATNPDLP